MVSSLNGNGSVSGKGPGFFVEGEAGGGEDLVVVDLVGGVDVAADLAEAATGDFFRRGPELILCEAPALFLVEPSVQKAHQVVQTLLPA